MDPKTYERYSRQILFREIGEAGQHRLLDSSAVMVGCGALGTALANLLVRAGLGRLRIVDRDFVEPSNLQRQTLFEESDAQQALPKAVAAERRLRAINSGVTVEGVVADLSPKNAEELLRGFPLILDGTDNFETRFLLNDAAIHLNIPWIYAAVVATYGVTLTVRPGETACLACALESGSENGAEPDGADGEDTCDTVGVLGAAAGVIASIEAAEAIKLLAGKSEAAGGRLVSFDVWSGKYRSVRVARNPDCRACSRRDFRYLDGEAQPHLTMCGRDSVQIHERRRQLDLAALGKRIAPTAAEVRENGFLLRFRVPPYEMTVFADGRAIIKGTRDASVARSLYARYIGA
ncbi:MAG TPA: ThiF family adenylyltransferase [Candidatus Sulfotelmatobacter sp.]|jgi:molybdopterin/thiamine biosynthesis adenylyltransferase|nr:ThiF family adenylyltransferase [Candidatus Sulfotelmatobacter sp.]